ncbi:unnamed protein product [Peronospora farinosa]|uniref:Equilibrative nucleoside transporter 1 n=1 Tax=Peronospora farinosa TaxID=134698 RepID=A0AAV0TD93_9STRA|nr:unnamed protein product [Peronospora farinosa]CAI5719921.1 unnamed protein product [Peronospora farinosa]
MGGRQHTSGVVFAIFFFIGIGSSLPWNVFITAQAYFQHRLSGTTYEDSFLNWFSMAFNVSTLMTMLIRTTVIADRMASAVRTVLFSLVVIMGVISMHCAWTRMPEFHGYSFFYTTIVSIILVACASTLMQEGLLRIVATFPPRYTQAVVSGQSFAGLAVSLSNMIILWAGEDDSKFFYGLHANADLCALLYFVLVFITLVLCLLSFAVLTRMQLFRHYQRVDHPGHNPKLYFDDASSEADTVDASDASPRKRLLDGEDDLEDTGDKVDMLEIAFKIRFYVIATFFIFIVTLGIFPGITSMIKSMHPERGVLFDQLFTPFTLVLFNASDFVARLSASWWPTLGQKRVLLVSIGRLLFFPLLMLCNLQNKSHEVITKVVFRSDVLAILFIAGCAFSNGLLCALAFMEYPNLLHKNAEKELGGSIIFFVLSLGLTGGSLMSFVLRAMLKP